MKKHILITALLSILFLTGCSTIKPVAYDKFRNQTTYSTKKLAIEIDEGKGYAKAGRIIARKVVSHNDNNVKYQLKISTQHEGMDFINLQKGDSGTFMANNQETFTFHSENGSEEHLVVTGMLLPTYLESITFSNIDEATFEKLATANKVEFSILGGETNLVGSLKPQSLATIRQFYHQHQ